MRNSVRSGRRKGTQEISAEVGTSVGWIHSPNKMGTKQLDSSARQPTAHRSVVGGQKIPCQAQCDSLGASAKFFGHVTARRLPVPATRKCSQRTMIGERRGSHCKIDGSTDRVSKNGFQEVFISLLLPEGLTLKEMLCKQTPGYSFLCKKSIPVTS
jgi:hypothetical protein